MTNHELIPAGPDPTETIHSPMVDMGAGDDFKLHELVNIWVRRRWLILGSIAVGIVCAALLIVFLKPVYEATATIELNKGNSGSLDLGMGGGAAGTLQLGGGDLETDLKTEVEVLKTSSLAMAVIKDLNLSAQPPFRDKKHPPLDLRDEQSISPAARARLVEIFKSHLRVDSVSGTKLITVSFRSHDPKQCTEVANAIIDSYREMYLQSHYAAVSQASDWMTKQLADLKQNVENSEKRLTDYEKASGILTVPTATTLPSGESAEGSEIHSPVIQRLDALNEELIEAETERVQKEAIYRLAKAGNPDVILGLEASPVAQGSSILSTDRREQGLQSLESKRSDLLVTIAQGRSTYGPNNRHLKDLQTQLNAVDAQVEDEMKKIVERAGADLKVAQQTEDSIRARFNDEQAEASKLNDKNVQLSLLSQEASSQKQLYEDLYTKLQEADVSAGMKATNITVVDPAFAPSMPVLPKPAPFIEVGMLLGALLGFGAAHLMDAVDNTVVSLPQIEEITGAAVLAVIPDFKASAASKKSRGENLTQGNGLQTEQSTAWILNHPTSIASEAFRALRTGVLLSRPGGILKTLLVTSSVPGEGKSTVTFNLAVAMAQNGKKVIIVEADMRRPMMKRYMGVTSEIGLSSVVTDFASLDDAIIHGVGTSNLDVLPAGPVPPLPAELLGSAKFDSVLTELRARYDVVLVDSPPALILTDAIAIAPKVDAVVWIVRAGTATRPHLVRAAQQVRRSRMPFIGFVLNGLDSRVDPYGYGYSYYGYDSKRYGAYYGENNNGGA